MTVGNRATADSAWPLRPGGEPDTSERASGAGERLGSQLSERHQASRRGKSGGAERLILGPRGWVPSLLVLSAKGLSSDSFRVLFGRAGNWHGKLAQAPCVDLDPALQSATGTRARGLREEDIAALLLLTCLDQQGRPDILRAFWRALFGTYRHALTCLPFLVGLGLLRRCESAAGDMPDGFDPLVRAAIAVTRQRQDQANSAMLVDQLLKLRPPAAEPPIPAERPAAVRQCNIVLTFPETLVPSARAIRERLSGPDRHVTVAGRVTAVRGHRKTIFLDVEAAGHRLQAAIRQDGADTHGPRVGQLVCLSGELASAKSGEPTLFVEAVPWTSDAGERVSPPGLPDTARSLAMAQTLEAVRKVMKQHGFREQATSVLGPYRGGNSRPFETWLHAEQRPVYLRATMEEELRSLIIAGIPRCFQIGPAFRNTDRGRWHNPEYLLLEAYGAFMSLDEITTIAVQAVLAGLGLKRTQKVPVIDLSALPSASAADPDRIGENGIAALCRRGASSRTGLWVCDGLPPAPSPLNDSADPVRWILVGKERVAEIAAAATDSAAIRAGMAEQVRHNRPDIAREDESFLGLLRYGHPPCVGIAISLSRIIQIRAGGDRLENVLPYLP